MRLPRLLATGLLASLLLPASPAPAAEETCQGRPATHVGAPGQVGLSGTEGPDVVVTGGATAVRTLGGDDLVCVTGEALGGASLDTGAGNDVVDASGATGRVDAALGAGGDRYTGAAADDNVRGGVSVADGGADTEPDSITTGSGTDSVFSGTPGSDHPNADVVVLGSGGGALGGQVAWFGPMAPGARLDGGTPGNTLTTEVRAQATSRVVVDARTGTLTRDGEVVLAWKHFDALSLSAATPPAELYVRGSERDERLSLRMADADAVRQWITLRGGDDTLWMGDDAIGEAASGYLGGAGADHAVVWSDHPLDVDLSANRLETVRQGRTHHASFVGFETQLIGAERLTLEGTRRSEDLRFWACAATVRGRGGRDDIALSKGDDDFAVPACRRPSIRLRGDGGDDRLKGTRGDDTLLGGPGRDTIRGDAGRDRCSGERLKACEVRLRD